MTPQLDVELHGRVIGELVDEGAGAAFQFRRSYWEDPDRFVLGQWFEDGGRDEVYRGPGSLPAFFANLEPEGALGRWLARKNQIGSGTLELLSVSGDDLPGAIRLVRVDPILFPPRAVVFRRPPPTPSFSLAGVQLKLPMSLDRDDRLTLPLPGELSEWFAKVPMAERYRGLVENEAATMNWARHAGFATAECRVHAPPSELEADMGVEPGRVENVLLVRRFDRLAGKRVHQEDLAQTSWLDPEQKYPRETSEPSRFDLGSENRRRSITTPQGLARYVARLLGSDGLEEYLRRFVFVVASGNGDAHVKNWSVWYPDGRRPQWTPLYDQVSTVAWHDETLACPLFGTPNFAAIGRDLLTRMATEVGSTGSRADQIVSETLERCRSAWAPATSEVDYPPDHRARLIHHWESVPLLREAGALSR